MEYVTLIIIIAGLIVLYRRQTKILSLLEQQAQDATDTAQSKTTGELYQEALKFCRTNTSINTSLLQKELHIGYGRAMRLVDRLSKDNVITPDATGSSYTVVK